MEQSWQEICFDYADAVHIEKEKASFQARVAGAKFRKK